MQHIKLILKHWLPVALVTTALSGLVYITMQQVLRQAANDPQIQLAEDSAATLARGGKVETVVPAAKVDVAESLAPFLIVFNNRGEAVSSSGLLHGNLPILRGGVLGDVQQHGEDRITWQPEPGVRIAAVVTSYGGANPGYVLAGRSLREVERRISTVGLVTGVVGCATLGLLLLLVVVSEFWRTARTTGQ